MESENNFHKKSRTGENHYTRYVSRQTRETTSDTGTRQIYIDNELYVPYEIDKDVTPRQYEEIRDNPKGVNLGETPPPKRQGPSPPKYNTGHQHATYDRQGLGARGQFGNLNNLNKNVKKMHKIQFFECVV